MVKNTYSKFMILFYLGVLSFNISAAGGNISVLPDIQLQDLKTVAIDVNTPTTGDYRYLQRAGATKEKLEENISKQLQTAGFNIISLNDAQNDPTAALIEVRIRLSKGFGALFSTSVQVTVKQKVSLGQNASPKFYADTWSGGVNTSLSQQDLPSILIYTRELVDDLIKVNLL